MQTSTRSREATRARHMRPPPAARWRFPPAQAIACLLILLGVCVLLYPQTASWFAQREQSRATESAQERLEAPPADDPGYRAEQIELAREYNDALSSGALLKANTPVATGEGDLAKGSPAYDELLDPTGTGFMGRLQYPLLGIDLPIYHGTADNTLRKGVGHLEGTSLPVGGVGTRAVLTAHRGLPESTLFTHLDRAEVGDTFTISVLDEVLTYRIFEKQVVDPADTEEILANPDRDLVTLVTCTPLGINSHRILVTAERVTPTPPAEIRAAATHPDLPGFPWWAVGVGAAVTLLTVYVVWAGRARPTRSVQPRRSST